MQPKWYPFRRMVFAAIPTAIYVVIAALLTF